jgi:competence protein ComFC
MTNLLKLTWQGFLDLVYPPSCLICEQYDRPAICDDCHASFEPIPEPVCVVCGRPETDGVPCRLCTLMAAEGGWGFDAARAAGIYWGPLRHAVHLLKYRNVELLGEPLGAYLANRVVAEGLLASEERAAIEVVVPLPLHPGRERSRGYNQAALLAAPVAEMLGVPLLPLAVRRVKRATPQVGLSPEMRRRNVGTEMFAADPALVQGKSVLLVDDVFTTGATVSACARALKAAGASSVRVVTLAAGG